MSRKQSKIHHSKITQIKRKLSGYLNIKQIMIDNEKIIKKEKGYYTMMKESIYQDIAILNKYVPNNKA